jgi:MoaA/NifB/PqqE/SkfB family radical SAM enzyme
MVKPKNPNILTGLHILLTYQCTFECDHCFAWGSPWQKGTLSLPEIREILAQAKELSSISQIYFEGGEPFLYYATLVKAVDEAHQAGFDVGVVSNAYWAITPEDAMEWLRPFAGKISDLSVSSDLFHYDETYSRQARNASQAAKALGIPTGVICIARPDSDAAKDTYGTIPSGADEAESAIMFRGRAAINLAPDAGKFPWRDFDSCPHEDLRSPGRLHLDPAGYLHICQGITLGNIFKQSIKVIWEDFDPETHPIIGPMLTGGPAELRRRYGGTPDENYADACHLCYQTRANLRSRFQDILVPDQMYGVF